MENKISPELIEKAKSAKTPEELMAFAKESGVAMTEDESKAYFAQLNPKPGELSDEELDNVSGGACYRKDGRMVTTVCHKCRHWRCKKDDGKWLDRMGMPGCSVCGIGLECSNCRYLSYEKGLWLCNCSANRKK